MPLNTEPFLNCRLVFVKPELTTLQKTFRKHLGVYLLPVIDICNFNSIYNCLNSDYDLPLYDFSLKQPEHYNGIVIPEFFFKDVRKLDFIQQNNIIIPKQLPVIEQLSDTLFDVNLTALEILHGFQTNFNSNETIQHQSVDTGR
jgi:hypothetical protein